MDNANISALFSAGSGEDVKAVTLSLSSRAHQVAHDHAMAQRLSKRRWLELLVENIISEYAQIGGIDGGRSEKVPENLVSPKRVEANQVSGGGEGHLGAEFDSLRNHEGGE